jgi:serine/threonine protein kinase
VEGYVVDGRFHLRQYLGGSAQSDVFLTEYGQGSPQKAAIKLVPADWAKAHAWTLRCESARKLSHPGLLSIFEVGTCRIDDADWAYAVMELADEDLSQVIPLRPLVAGEAREMLTAAVGPLAYLHERGFVHGHLTPANIMAARDRIKISSDGLLRIGKSSGDRWTPNANDAPEIRTGVTPASDVWSLGMTLAEVLTQHAPAWDRSAANDPAVPGTLGAPFGRLCTDVCERILDCASRSRTFCRHCGRHRPHRDSQYRRNRRPAAEVSGGGHPGSNHYYWRNRYWRNPHADPAD